MDRQDGCRDVLVPREAASLDQLPSDASPEGQTAWDASGDAHLAATADGIREGHLLDAGAEKSAGLGPADRALDGQRR